MKLRFSVMLKNLKELMDPRNFLCAPSEIALYMKDKAQFNREYRGNYPIRALPVLFERKKKSIFDPHYVYQAWWATRKIVAAPTAVDPHVDIASHVQFTAQLSAFCPVIQVEFRPPEIELTSYERLSGDIHRLPFRDSSVSSLTCLHVIEHLGLGRYGDPLDTDGCWKGLLELQRIAAPKGNLLLSVPVGRKALYFNGGYVFDAHDIPETLRDLDLLAFSYVNDDGRFVESGNLDETHDMVYALGLFHFRKPI